jgi:hypothetical protein
MIMKNFPVFMANALAASIILFVGCGGDDEPTPVPNPDAYAAVDLGLPSGVLWAECNVGAHRPEEAGQLFAWAETSAKTDYTWVSYSHCEGSSDDFTRYCTSAKNGTADGQREVFADDDAATVLWGAPWRMPTRVEMDELRTQCKWTVDTVCGTQGLRVVGRNGNSIFLPATGYRESAERVGSETSGFYWTSGLAANDSLAYSLYFFSRPSVESTERFLGKAIRAVRSAE